MGGKEIEESEACDYHVLPRPGLALSGRKERRESEIRSGSRDSTRGFCLAVDR